jgi:hypothetical protein
MYTRNLIVMRRNEDGRIGVDRHSKDPFGGATAEQTAADIQGVMIDLAHAFYRQYGFRITQVQVRESGTDFLANITLVK